MLKEVFIELYNKVSDVKPLEKCTGIQLKVSLQNFSLIYVGSTAYSHRK